MPETAEELCQQPEVREELERTTSAKKPGEKVKAQPKDKFWFVTHALLLIGCAVVYYLIGSRLIPLLQREADIGRGIGSKLRAYRHYSRYGQSDHGLCHPPN